MDTKDFETVPAGKDKPRFSIATSLVIKNTVKEAYYFIRMYSEKISPYSITVWGEIKSGFVVEIIFYPDGRYQYTINFIHKVIKVKVNKFVLVPGKSVRIFDKITVLQIYLEVVSIVETAFKPY